MKNRVAALSHISISFSILFILYNIIKKTINKIIPKYYTQIQRFLIIYWISSKYERRIGHI